MGFSGIGVVGVIDIFIKKFLKVFEIIIGIYFVSRSVLFLVEFDVLCIILLVRLLFFINEKLEDLFFYRKLDDSGFITEEMKSFVFIIVTLFFERYESVVEGDDLLDEENVYRLNFLCLNKKIFNYL